MWFNKYYNTMYSPAMKYYLNYNNKQRTTNKPQLVTEKGAVIFF